MGACASSDNRSSSLPAPHSRAARCRCRARLLSGVLSLLCSPPSSRSARFRCHARCCYSERRVLAASLCSSERRVLAAVLAPLSGACSLPCFAPLSGACSLPCFAPLSGAYSLPCCAPLSGAYSLPCCAPLSGAYSLPCLAPPSGALSRPCCALVISAHSLPRSVPSCPALLVPSLLPGAAMPCVCACALCTRLREGWLVCALLPGAGAADAAAVRRVLVLCSCWRCASVCSCADPMSAHLLAVCLGRLSWLLEGRQKCFGRCCHAVPLEADPHEVLRVGRLGFARADAIGAALRLAADKLLASRHRAVGCSDAQPACRRVHVRRGVRPSGVELERPAHDIHWLRALPLASVWCGLEAFEAVHAACLVRRWLWRRGVLGKGGVGCPRAVPVHPRRIARLDLGLDDGVVLLLGVPHEGLDVGADGRRPRVPLPAPRHRRCRCLRPASRVVASAHHAQRAAGAARGDRPLADACRCRRHRRQPRPRSGAAGARCHRRRRPRRKP